MTRVALLIVALTACPAVGLAQAPPPAAPVPLPAPRPMPADVPDVPFPVAVPVPPVSPVPPAPPMPPVPPVAVSPFEMMELDLADLRHEFAFDQQFEYQAMAEAARASADLVRDQAVSIAQSVNIDMKMRMSGDAYNRGLNALQQRQYDRALEAFDRVIADAAERVDAALYWKAFTEFRLARTDAALRTLARLQKEHAQSRYLGDARVLETEVRKQTGQTIDPAQLDNDDIKLLAIQGLQRTEQVVPLLEGVLGGANSLNVKKRALFVLALGTDPRAREVLMRYAKGAGTPDLQMEAVRLLVSRRDAETTGAVLRDLYESSADTAVRRTIIDAYGGLRGRQAGEGGGLRASAPQDLATLYQRETDSDLRRQIVGVLVSLNALDQVSTLIRGERDPDVRRRAIGALSSRRGEATAQTLVAMYPTFTDQPSREAIINALGQLQSAESLIGLARTESNLTLKTRIVRHLSEMAPRNKAAADYLMDVIK